MYCLFVCVVICLKLRSKRQRNNVLFRWFMLYVVIAHVLGVLRLNDKRRSNKVNHHIMENDTYDNLVNLSSPAMDKEGSPKNIISIQY